MRRGAFQLSLFIMLLFGALDMSRGVAAPMMQHDWRLDYLQLGTIFISNSFGYLAGSFMSGFVADKYGLKLVMVAGGGLTASGVGLICGLHSYFSLIAGFLCMGVGSGWLEIGMNSVVPAISEHPRQQASYFNILHGFYGLAACCFPLVAVWIIQMTNGWRPLYVILWAASLIVFCIILLMNFRSYQHNKSDGHIEDPLQHTTRAFWRQPMLYLLLAASAAYAMAETGVASWLPAFMVQVHGMSVAHSSIYLSGFYLTFTIGRLTAKYWVSLFGQVKSVLLFAGFGFVLIGLAIFVPHGEWAFIFAGFGYSIVFPTVASVASHLFAQHAGKVLGLIFTAGGLGNLVVNGWIGYISTAYGLMAGFSFILLFMGLVVICMSVVAATSTTSASGQTQIDVAS